MNPKNPKLVDQFFELIVRYPKTMVILSLVLMIATLSQIPKLYKDTRSDAFLEADNPALLYRNKVKAQFGLADPIVIAVVNEGETGVFNPETLVTIESITEAITALDNIDSDRVMSLATENNITGTDEGMDVTPFFDPFPSTQADADRMRSAVNDFPLYLGSLVSESGQATMIVAEVLDEKQVEETYQQVVATVNSVALPDGVSVHVAGEGAIAGFLGGYIDADASRLNPMAGLVITIMIGLAFRRFSPAILGNVIIAASVLMTLSIMAASDVAFFVITNALPVILIGISVADAIHVYSHYFELQAAKPDQDRRSLVVETMQEIWRPITLTSLTTIAGFLGLYFAAYMPPFKYFGLFTAVGVAIAWIYSLVFLPAAIALLKPSASQQFVTLHKTGKHDFFSRFMVWIGGISLAKPAITVGLGVVIILSGVKAATELRVNENRIETFDHSESIYQADQVINRFFDGTNNIDVVFEAKDNEGLFKPENLNAMAAFQEYALSLANVEGATSIVDYLKQMNRSLNEGRASEYRLPDSKELAAQYFLIYSASGEPTDFEEEVDYDYRMANVRITLNQGSFVETKPVVEALQVYIDQNLATEELKATLSGRVTLNYFWIKDLGQSHFTGLFISLLLVWLVSSLLFKSGLAGFYTLIPVGSSILLVYSTMVLMEVDLGIGTSMFASVAIGLGVDFAIHTIDRLRSLYQTHNQDLDAALVALFPSTGRALFFNFLAIACGFGVLISSKVVPLNNFGTIVVIAVSTSFLASVTFLPALIKLTRPAFIVGKAQSSDSQLASGAVRSLGFAVFAVGALSLFSVEKSWAMDSKITPVNTIDTQTIDTKAIVDRVNAVDEGEHQVRTMDMKLIDRRGKVRERSTESFRKYFGEEKRTILFYRTPTNVQGTAFLTYDYPEAEVDDDQWLYLPALRKVRRISASDRGDYFLGTDFTYEDIKQEGKLEEADYNYRFVGEEILLDRHLGERKTYRMEGIPKSDIIKKELGYSRTEFWVDADYWVVLKAEYWDVKGNHLKSLEVTDIRTIDGYVTRHQMNVDNHKTGHRTEFTFSQVDYQSPVKDNLFSKRAMKRGK
ncbi:outer membrane lipoprotein-sorting protein [Litoribrevibacter euphylliae]|uniref:Outer membrane lipoprotein-sorting protein n=1 Tax=Litoribrevibacter euphylliae TaxID=1834034 RepID=A0ABV7HBI1_9GAMM